MFLIDEVKDEVVVVDDPSDSANQSKNEEKPHDHTITGTGM